MSSIDYGHRTLVLRHRLLAGRWALRTLLVCGLLTAATLLMGLWALASGDFVLDLSQVIGALTGSEEGLVRTVVVQWRAPRVLGAILFGAALGTSGAIFQSLTRNPLASPDIIGFSAGSYTGALLVIFLLGGSFAMIASGAFIGGLATAVLVYVLAYSRGVKGFRLIIVGIGISAMLGSLNTWMMMRADHEVALVAAVWGAGTLNGIGWERTLLGGAAALLLLILTIRLSPALRQMELGDDAARALGVRVELSRLTLIFAGVGLTAVVTAAAGPISFIALAAPQIARRLARAPGVSIMPAAAMGALLLLGADTAAQHVLPTALPVGVVTVIVGGGYLVWLLIHEARRRKAS